MDPRWLPADFPRLFHVAEEGAWPSIQQLGLLSTTALLDLYGYEGEERERYESQHRPNSIPLTSPGLPRVVLRDQRPLDMKQLAECLEDGLSGEDWLKLLNGKVFLWATQDRLDRLLGAAAYRDRAHDVLTIDTRPLMERHRSKITLTQINSGATKPARAKRGLRTFRPIELYPEEPKERRRIAEVAVDYAVPDIADLVLHVERRHSPELVERVWSRDDQASDPRASG